ncbi:hypothetical protein ABKA04_004883 [Annulohypoxylon sp. FPYF3050]
MDASDSQGLLKAAFKFLVGKRPDESTQPASPRSQTREAWLRADAFLQQDNDEFGELDHEHTSGTLRALENCFEYKSDGELDPCLRHDVPYPKLQAIRNMTERQSHTSNSNPRTTFRVSKRKREGDAVIKELSHLDRKAKQRRALPREEPIAGDDLDDPNADFAVLMRKHLVSLDNALRKHWKNANGEISFEVFFGVRSPSKMSLQEAKITINGDSQNYKMESASDFTHICQSITESLGQRNCLHLALEDGIFQRLRPQPKSFGVDHISRTISLSALFKRQQELRGGLSALPQKGKRILAVILATALLPFLETPWLQLSFNHSNILFFEPLQDGGLPDITKPFLAMEHMPIVSTGKISARIDSDSSKHMVHPNASVLALGILLCELQYCTPVELMQEDSRGTRNVNSDYYTSLDMLKTLEVDAGVDYYLATKACLQWEYYPPGKQADFESVDVQRLFYQKVIKRLEADIFKSWGLRIEMLGSLDNQHNRLCWGVVGREVIHDQIRKANTPNINIGAQTPSYRSVSDAPASTYISLRSDMVLRTAGPAQPSPRYNFGGHLVEPSMKSLHLFDASHQTNGGQESPLSQQWMENLMFSIHQYVDPLDAEHRTFEPVRIAILDSGFDPENPLLMTHDRRLDPRIKGARSFVYQTDPDDTRDEIGHGTHALGLLLKVATCAEIYIARIARRATLDRTSNDGANLGRAFPAKYPSVFCIHSTDGNGNPSAFNPTADGNNVNFSLLGENVSSHWPAGKNGHNETVNVMSGTSVATPIASGIAAAILSFVRQQEQYISLGSEFLGSWLKDVHSMNVVFKTMVKPGGKLSRYGSNA